MNDQVWIKVLDKSDYQTYIRATKKTRKRLIEMEKAEKPKFYDLKFVKEYYRFNSKLFKSNVSKFWKHHWKWLIPVLLGVIYFIVNTIINIYHR